MNEEFDEFREFRELEARLRAAHSFTPREGLQGEIRAALRPGRTVPWAGFSAAAAVLLAVAGVGLLLHQAPSGGTAPASSAAQFERGGAAGSGASAIAAFGKLPRPPSELKATALQASSTALQASSAPSVVPNSGYVSAPGALTVGVAPVFKYPYPRRPCPTNDLMLDGATVLGGAPCVPAERTAPYRLTAEPSGATLIYVGVVDGSVEYYEPAYMLADGSVVTALTPDELR